MQERPRRRRNQEKTEGIPLPPINQNKISRRISDDPFSIQEIIEQMDTNNTSENKKSTNLNQTKMWHRQYELMKPYNRSEGEIYQTQYNEPQIPVSNNTVKPLPMNNTNMQERLNNPFKNQGPTIKQAPKIQLDNQQNINTIVDNNIKKTKFKIPKWVKTLVLVLIAINISLIALNISFNAYIISSQTSKKSEYERIKNNHPLYYRSDIEKKANRYNLQPAYVSAIIKCESSFRPEAQSEVGALGLMQLMPSTAEWISEKLDDSLYAFEKMADPVTNMEYGCWYLNFLSKRFNGDPILTTAAYHTGQGQVANWLADKSISKDGQTINIENMPDGPTKQYVRRVVNAYAVYDALFFTKTENTKTAN